MNQINLIGNLTHDPELSSTNSGIAVCNFSIAVNRKFKNADGERGVDFFNCVAWRKLGDTVAKYLKKGHKVSIVGHVESDRYEDKDGNKRTSFRIVADDIEFLTAKETKEDETTAAELTASAIDK